MLFKIVIRFFSHKKLFVFLSYFFFSSKEAYREWQSETSRIRIFSNLVPRIFSYPPYRARESETLENAGHVTPEQN